MKAQLAAWPATAVQAGRSLGGRLAAWARQTRAHRRLVAGTVVVVVALVAAAGLVVSATSSYGDPGRPVHPASSGVSGNASLPMLGDLADGRVQKLPPATTTAAPAPAALAAAAPMAAHEVFGFAPYWTLGQSTGFDLAGLTTVAYFSIGINPNGTLDESGSGWNGYGSQALVNLIDRAHAAGVRVVLTVNDFDQQSLNQLTASPTAAGTLAQALITAVQAKNLDGVNLDLEGTDSADQGGLTNLVTTVAGALHQVDPHWQVTMDTYASAAADPGGFYDIPALAQAVDGFFVMQYSPNLSGSAEATSPLTSPLFSDLTTAKQYTAVVPAAKVILGAPFYGLDWPTTGDTLAATATGTVADLSYAQIAAASAAGRPTYWDPVTDSAWTAYQVGTQWHETFFDDPTSLYEVGQLADQYGLGGVGIWALGMDGNDPAMVAALDGTAPSITYAPSPGTPPAPTAAPSTTTPSASTTGPAPAPAPASVPASGGGVPSSTSTSTTAPPAATTTTTTTSAGSTASGPGTGAGTPTYTAQGVWDAKTVTLVPEPAVPAAALTQSGAKKVGTLTGFSSTDPAMACLQDAPTLAVWQLPATSSSTSTTTTTTTTTTQPGDGPQYTVVATQPADCSSAAYTFNPPPGTWSSGSATTTTTS